MGLAKKPAASVPGNRKPRKRSAAEFGTERRIKQKYERKIVRANISGGMKIIDAVTREQYKLRCVEIVPLNLTLTDLPDDGCHYIPGDDLLYCGHPIQAGSKYCTPHHHIVWVKPIEKPALARKYSGTDFARGAA